MSYIASKDSETGQFKPFLPNEDSVMRAVKMLIRRLFDAGTGRR